MESRPGAIAATTHGCVVVVIIAVSQFVAGGSVFFVGVMVWVMQTRLTTILEEKEARMTTIPVVARTLGIGTVLTAADLVEQRIDRSFVPPRALRNPAVLIGRTVRERVLEGDFVYEERLAPESPHQGFNAVVPTGVRALSVDLREGDRVAGWLEPGNAVDLLVTLPGDGVNPPETVTVVQAVRVLAVDEKISETAKGDEVITPRVTLAVPLDFAEGVVHSLAVGQGKLSLRSDIDLHRQETNGARSFETSGADGRISVAEFRARYSEADVNRWFDIVHGNHTVREAVVDPEMLRGIGGDPGSNADVIVTQ